MSERMTPGKKLFWMFTAAAMLWCAAGAVEAAPRVVLCEEFTATW